MSFADNYFLKYKYFPAQINDAIESNLQFIIIIPCLNEPHIIRTLESIKQNSEICSSCEIIVLINSSENSKPEIIEYNTNTFCEVKKWIEKNSEKKKKFHVQNIQNLPKRFAGAGLARKIAMDEALRRFNLIDNPKGFIISLDADTICEKNYLQEIENHINKTPDNKAFTINFEHPVEGNEYSSEIYSAITLYEIYLRYYIEALRYSGFPYAFHTIGSAFGVRTDIYAKQGGMNTKQAGEDFYFLHKIIPLGNFHEINSTKVHPSPRISNRVPFGTGVVIEKIISEQPHKLLTYNFQAFEILKTFFEIKNNYFKNSEYQNIKIHESLSEFLEMNNFREGLAEINKNSPNIKTFEKRFFEWFDAFRVLKFLNFAHEKYFSKNDVILETLNLLKIVNISCENPTPENFLKILRKVQTEN